jgi:hypothetical protein
LMKTCSTSAVLVGYRWLGEPGVGCSCVPPPTWPGSKPHDIPTGVAPVSSVDSGTVPRDPVAGSRRIVSPAVLRPKSKRHAGSGDASAAQWSSRASLVRERPRSVWGDGVGERPPPCPIQHYADARQHTEDVGFASLAVLGRR